MTLNIQFLTMITMITGGFYLGMAHETFRYFSPYWRKKVILTYVLELSFWLSHTFLLFYLLYRVNGGEIRLYVFIACLFGFSIYQGLMVNLYKRLLERLIRVVTSIARALKKIFVILVIKPLKGVLYLLVFIIQTAFIVIYYPIKVLLFPFTWTLGKIYQRLPRSFQKIITKWGRFYSIIKNKCPTWMKNMMIKRR